MNPPMDELDRLRRDWHSGELPRPRVQIGQLRRRLWRRWLGLAMDVIIATVVLVLIMWAAFQVTNLMSGIYVGFFAMLWVVLFWQGMRLRLQGFRLDDTSPAGIVIRALRQARAMEQSGRLGIAAGTVVLAFFLVWLGVVAYQAGMGPIEILAASLSHFLFVALVCTIAILAGLWTLERGRNRQHHLQELLAQLTERDEP